MKVVELNKPEREEPTVFINKLEDILSACKGGTQPTASVLISLTGDGYEYIYISDNELTDFRLFAALRNVCNRADDYRGGEL